MYIHIKNAFTVLCFKLYHNTVKNVFNTFLKAE